MGLSQLLFRRRTAVWVLGGLVCLTLLATLLGPGQRQMMTPAPTALLEGHSSGLSGPAAAALQGGPSSGLSDPAPSQPSEKTPTQRPAVEVSVSGKQTEAAEARPQAEGELRPFQMKDNPAYRPGAELPLSGDGAPDGIQSHVGDLLMQGATHLISRALLGPSTAGSKPPPPQPAGQQTGQAGQRTGQVGQRTGPASPRKAKEPPRFTPPHQLLVHLDLKGAPPSVPFLRSVLELSAGLGATGLLIEWEDKFPFWGPLQQVAAGNAYTMDQVREIVSAARALNLTVMPLVQTFGHVEFVLKLAPFAHLREDPSTPQALCPSRNASAQLVELMLDQVMAAHPGADRVHIGSDEVFVLGRCELCRRRRRDELLLSHIARTARYVRSRYNATAVLWEDMLRNAPTSGLRKYGLDQGLVEPMLWWYTPNVRKYVAPMVWRHAERVYPHVWGAGAFKGGFGSALFSPPIDRHVQNNLDWTELLAEEDGRLAGGVRGLVLTGWSRYDHFATLPELLAAAVPCLAFSLAAVRRGALDEAAAEAAQRALGCATPAPLAQLRWPYLYTEMEQCDFPGRGVYRMMKRFNDTAVSVRNFLGLFETGQQSAWLGRYNARHNFTSVLKVREHMPQVRRHRLAAASLLSPLFRELSAVYDRDLVLEWLEQRVLPLLEDLDALKKRLETLEERRVFPVRPIRGYPEHFVSYLDEFVRGWRSSR